VLIDSHFAFNPISSRLRKSSLYAVFEHRRRTQATQFGTAWLFAKGGIMKIFSANAINPIGYDI
jgi:hypothetical protein